MIDRNLLYVLGNTLIHAKQATKYIQTLHLV